MMRFRHAWGWIGAVGVLIPLGCDRGEATPTAHVKPFQGVKLVVAAVGDPAILQAMAAQRADWEQGQGGTIEVRQGPVEPGATEGVDVLIFPGDRLGDLVDAGALAVLPESATREAPTAETKGDSETPARARNRLAFADVAPGYRDLVARYGSDWMALPFGGTALVLVYRRDAMASEANQAAARAAGLTLGPPTTWEQFDRLAKFFQGRDWDGDGKTDFGAALALGADAEGVGEAIFLARAAGAGQHPDQYAFLFDADTMEPRIDGPPFVEALGALAALKACGPPGVEGFDAEAARSAFRSGKVALLIDRAERFARWTDPKAPISVGVAPLPGSDRLYDPDRRAWEAANPPNRPSFLPRGGGWLVGVSAVPGKSRDAAIDFIKYLAGFEVAGRVRGDRSFPMLPVRESELGLGLPDPRSAPGVQPREWSDAVSRTLLTARVVPGLRIPDASGYLADLGKARVAAVNGQPADAALREAARAWSDRTKKRGVQRQLWHYRRSLNALTTSPEPPPRDDPKSHG